MSRIDFVLMFVLFAARAALGHQEQQEPRPIAGPASAKEARELYAAHVAEASLETLDHLERYGDTSLALHAAWEKAWRSVEELEGGFSDAEPETLEHWLGMFRQRVGTNPPGWWKKIFLDGGLNPKSSSLYHKTSAGMLVSKDTWVRTNDDGWLVGIGRRSVLIPNSMVAQIGQTPDRLAVHIYGDRVYVVPHDTFGYRSKLFCIDVFKNKVLWTADVWAGDYHGSATGIGGHYVSIVPHGPDVLVFGVGFGFYVEAFSAADGTGLMRFSTRYR